MTDKPTTGELSRGAKDFVRENHAYLIDYGRLVIIPILLTRALGIIGPHYFTHMQGLIVFVDMILASYFSACFVLSWHRASLLGAKRDHAVNPFGLKQGEGRFVGVFFALTLLMMVSIFVVFIPAILIGIATKSIAFIVIVTLVLSLIAIAFSMRFSFLLPARSVNASISWGESWRISKGLTWRLITAVVAADFFPFLLNLLILMVVYTALSRLGMLQPDELGVPKPTPSGSIVLYVFAGIPNTLIGFIMIARGVTILSKLYQWSVQNVAQPATTTT